MNHSDDRPAMPPPRPPIFTPADRRFLHRLGLIGPAKKPLFAGGAGSMSHAFGRFGLFATERGGALESES